MSHVLATLTNPSSARTDATLFVDLSTLPSSWWDDVDTTDGTKGRVYKTDGTTRLAADWIDFDSTAQTGVLAVLWTGTLASSGTQQVWIEPPITESASVSASDTYGQYNAYGSNVIEYWQNPLSLSGRKGHITLASSGTITEASGPLGSAAACSSGAYFYAPESDITTLSPFTIISAVNFNTYCGCHPFVLGQDYRVTGNSRCDLYPSVTSVLYNARIYTNNYASLSEVTAQSQWHQFAAVENVTSRSVYKDGVLKASNSGTVTGMTGLDSITVAWAHETAVSFGHIIWFNEALSEDYISFINDQIFDNATFWGTWEYVPDSGGTDLTPLSIVSTPVLGKPAIGQRHAVVPVGIISTPVVGKPTLSQLHSLSPLGSVSTPVLGKPTLSQGTITYNLTPLGIATQPVLGLPSIGQIHNLLPESLVDSIILGSPTLQQIHNLVLKGLVDQDFLGKPTLSQTHKVTPLGLQSTPVLGKPTLSQGAIVYNLTPLGLTSQAVLGLPSVSQIHKLAPEGLEDSIILGSPSLHQIHILSPSGLVETPTLGKPTLSQSATVYHFAPVGVVDSSILGKPTLSQTHILTPLGIDSTPILGKPRLNGSTLNYGKICLSGVWIDANDLYIVINGNWHQIVSIQCAINGSWHNLTN